MIWREEKEEEESVETACTMGEDTTGRTRTDELCFMLFFGLNRGKRHFLMTGGLPPGTSIWNKEAHDWWHRGHEHMTTTTRHDFTSLHRCRIRQSITHLKSRGRVRRQTRCWCQRTYVFVERVHRDRTCALRIYLTRNSPFEIFSFSSLLLWRNPASPFLWVAQRGSTPAYLGQSCKSKNKTKCTERDIPLKIHKIFQLLIRPDILC